MTKAKTKKAAPGAKTNALDLSLVVYEGETEHLVQFGDFNALDARDFRLEHGMSLLDAFQLALRGQPDIDILAALAWAHLRREDPGLGFDEVARRFTYETLMDNAQRRAAAQSTNGDAPEPEAEPEVEEDTDPS